MNDASLRLDVDARRHIWSINEDQTVLFCLFGIVFALLISGGWRHDVVAFCVMLAGVIDGTVPGDVGFAGFGYPADVIVALVLAVSRGLMNSGVAYHVT